MTTTPGTILQGFVSFDKVRLQESAETFHVDLAAETEAPPPESAELAPRLGVNIHLLQDDPHSISPTPPASPSCGWTCYGRMSKGAAVIASLLTTGCCARWMLAAWAYSGFSITDIRSMEAARLERRRM